jgi:DNA-binding transcriptional LysR family regulator
MTDLNALAVFASVVEAGGFTAAADQRGMAKARVSQVIAKLEAQLGATLFSRTTRRVAPTAAGQALYDEAVPLLRALQEAVQHAGGDPAGALTGTLRVAAAVEYAAHTLAPALAAFARLHPGLAVDLRTSDRVVDVLKDGIDVAIRMGWLRDSSLRAVRLGALRQVVVAAPAWVAQAPRIAHPRDLARRDWLALDLLPAPLTWKFTSARGQVHTVRVTARARTDSVAALRALAEQGLGATVMDVTSSEESRRAGRLVQLLPTWSLPQGGVFAVFPPGRHLPAKTRAFVDFYKAWLAQHEAAAG